MPEVSTLDIPTLLIAGSEDLSAPANTMAKMSDSMQRSRFHVIENAGHMVHQEKPCEFNKLTAEFLSGLPNG